MASKRSTLLLVLLMTPLLAMAQAEPSVESGETITLDAQADSSEWEQNPHFRAFYDLSVEMLDQRIDSVDVELYTQRSYEVFRRFADSMGVDSDGMVEHLQNIPREIVAIVKRDPTMLDSYEKFLVALRGPE